MAMNEPVHIREAIRDWWDGIRPAEGVKRERPTGKSCVCAECGKRRRMSEMVRAPVVGWMCREHEQEKSASSVVESVMKGLDL